MKRDFDEQVRAKYNSGEFVYQAANWQKLHEQIKNHVEPKQETKRTVVPFFASYGKWMVAASLLIVAISSALFLSITRNKTTGFGDSLSTTSQFSNHPPVNTSSPKQHSATRTTSTVSVPRSTHGAAVTTKRMNAAAPRISHSSTKASTVVIAHPIADPGLPTAILPQDNKKELTNPVQLLPGNTSSDRINVTAKIKPNSNVQKVNTFNDFSTSTDKQRSTPLRGLSISGSVGKGANNTVYSAGIQYEWALSNRFFIDGAVAFNSTKQDDVLVFNGVQKTMLASGEQVNNSFSAHDIQGMQMSSAIQSTNFANLAVNPSLGFKVNKRFAVKAGFDVQKNLNYTKGKNYVESGSLFKPLPSVDLGITPKIGIQLSEHWQSDLIYRKSMTKLFSPIDYFERNYFLFQLGYKFLVPFPDENIEQIE